ncbi:hypothetical protein NIES4075_01510 [Tolypothrix sp. NIES-4075]|nr:hypothetical protein NIES4075_01510 [Tolypothrix sp. NIES-4075]
MKNASYPAGEGLTEVLLSCLKLKTQPLVVDMPRKCSY